MQSSPIFMTAMAIVMVVVSILIMIRGIMAFLGKRSFSASEKDRARHNDDFIEKYSKIFGALLTFISLGIFGCGASVLISAVSEANDLTAINNSATGCIIFFIILSLVAAALTLVVALIYNLDSGKSGKSSPKSSKVKKPAKKSTKKSSRK